MTIAPLDLILLLGSLQGLILATLLWVNNKGRQLANRLLACLIGSLALMSSAVGVPITGRWISLAIDLLPFFLVMPLFTSIPDQFSIRLFTLIKLSDAISI